MKVKYIHPVAVLSVACELENKICAQSNVANAPSTVGFEAVKFKDVSDEKNWDDSWLE